jgi:hypothetical protein
LYVAIIKAKIPLIVKIRFSRARWREMQPRISSTAALQRISSIALMTGGTIALAAVFFPAGAEVVSFPAQYLSGTNISNSPLLVLVRAAGLVAIPLGFSNIHHFIRLGAGSAWARIGIQGLVVSSAGLLAVEGLLAGLSEDTADGETVRAAATSIMNLGQVFTYLALAALGIAMNLSTTYPRWSGMGLLSLGLLAAAIAVARFLLEPIVVLNVAAAGLAALTGVWIFAIGAWSARESWQAQCEPSRGESEIEEARH